MRLLRRVLYLEALVSVVLGVALAALPRFVLVTVFNQVPYEEYAWVRVVGIQLLGAAMLAVLVAQRVEELWFWGWAFAIPTALAFVVFGVNAAIGPDCATIDGVVRCPSIVLWFVMAALTGALSAALALALARAGNEAGPV
jgi:hypothetical protein